MGYHAYLYSLILLISYFLIEWLANCFEIDPLKRRNNKFNMSFPESNYKRIVP